MKKILITGAGGFIGSHLCEHLVSKGNKVRAFFRYNSRNTWGWLEQSPVVRDIELISGDLRDFDQVSRAVDGMDQVFHLGALIGIPYSYESPLAYIRTNVEGTYNILEAARKQKIERVLITSTSEVYGTAQYTPIDEIHPLHPQSPYAASKVGADQLALSYYAAFSLPVVIARPFNVFGPRQSARAVIPSMITQMLVSNKTIKLGSLYPTRDFTFVLDTITAMEAIVNTDSFLGKVVNIGSGKELSIEKVYQLVCKILGSDIPVQTSTERLRPENSEVQKLQANCNLLLQTTDWRPQYSLQKGLELAISWYRENIKNYKTGIYNI